MDMALNILSAVGVTCFYTKRVYLSTSSVMQRIIKKKLSLNSKELSLLCQGEQSCILSRSECTNDARAYSCHVRCTYPGSNKEVTCTVRAPQYCNLVFKSFRRETLVNTTQPLHSLLRTLTLKFTTSEKKNFFHFPSPSSFTLLSCL
jgi:hypothetical protein